MDIEQYVELDVREDQKHRIYEAFEDEVDRDHLEDIVEVFHHCHAERKEEEEKKHNVEIFDQFLFGKSILPYVNMHVPSHDFDNILHKQFSIVRLIHS
jgi:hypothetical protein